MDSVVLTELVEVGVIMVVEIIGVRGITDKEDRDWFRTDYLCKIFRFYQANFKNYTSAKLE